MSKKKTILVLQGIPACGKSTFAREYIRGKEDDWVIISRDSIRESTGKYWVPKREDFIYEVEKLQVAKALDFGLNVIIDDTNLNPAFILYWQELAKEKGVNIEFKLFKITLEEALKRDSKRDRRVGEKVIRDFYRRYKTTVETDIVVNNNPVYTDVRFIRSQDSTLPQAIVCDIDGTLSLRKNRSAYDYSKVDEDLPNNPVVDLINVLNKQYQIIIVSGREGTAECKEKTNAWLKKYLDDDYILLQRKEGDYRKDSLVKQEIYENYLKDNFYIAAVFDDRDQVVSMWREQGLLCNQVYYGNF